MFLFRNLLAIEMKSTWIIMSKPVFLGLSLLEISKIVMHWFQYDYVKPKYEEKAKLCYMDTDSFIVYIKTNDVYSEIPNYVETRFDTSNFESEIPLPKGKRKKVIGLMKDELGGKIMTEFAALRPKTHNYLTDNSDKNKKPKDTKKCIIKRKVKSEDYKHCLEESHLESKTNHLEKDRTDVISLQVNHKEPVKNNKLILKLEQRFIWGKLNVFTEEVNKNALSAKNNKINE